MNQHTLWLDLETYSGTDIKYGAHKYAEDPALEILVLAYALDDGEVKDWRPQTDIMPPELREAFNNDGCTLIAHNSAFDRTILHRIYPDMPVFATADRWKDTMVAASALSLPRSLDGLCKALGLPVDKSKDAAGKALIKLFCSPGKFGIQSNPETNPAEWEAFCRYCRQDVEAMRNCARRLPLHYNRPEVWSQIWSEWRLDQRINDRGICMDMCLANRVCSVCDAETREDAKRYPELTGGMVRTPSSVTALKAWLDTRNVHLSEVTAQTVSDTLSRTDIDDTVREVLEIRQFASLASVKKFEALRNAVNSDNRLRGCLVFMGTSRTGRFCGRTFQPQNLPRGTFKPEQVETAIKAFDLDMVDILYPSARVAGKECLRALLMAPEGRKLCVADLSNIEGRVLSWLAGEEWKIQAFRAFDEGHGPDLYKASYARTFGIRPEDVTKKQRQIGKVMELALGYQGGVGAFVNFARVYGIDLEGEFTHAVKAAIASQAGRSRAEDTESWRAARSSYDFMADKLGDEFNRDGLSVDAWTACQAVRTAWREAHPAIRRLWDEIKHAVVQLTRTDRERPDGPIKVGRTVFFGYRKSGGMDLLITLPSGRTMVYPQARAPRTGERADMMFTEYSGYTGGAVVKTYSGKLCENITQAVARDILVGTMQVIDDRGYQIVLSVHDELITECPDTPEYTHEELSRLMTCAPSWAEGLPLSAAGFTAKRYRKD